MKTKFLMLLLFFLLMAAVPLGLAIKNAHAEPSNEAHGEDERGILYAASMCDGECGEEMIKAAVILAETNLMAGGIPEDKGNNISDKELLSKVRSVFDSNREYLSYNGKAVPIPCAGCSNGFTVKGEQPYLEAVASPWDCFSGMYEKNLRCEGVSLNGIKTLCGKGLSAEEALLWYLPKLEIRVDGRSASADESYS